MARRQVTIKKGAGLGYTVPETIVEITSHGKVYWLGRWIGDVSKGARTYSPPTYRGSRVAKYHKQVPCWYAHPAGETDSYQRDTRQEAIRILISRQIQQSKD